MVNKKKKEKKNQLGLKLKVQVILKPKFIKLTNSQTDQH